MSDKMSEERKVANRFGRVFENAKETIERLDQLKPGDHIAYEHQYTKTYWHHMIVESITRETNEINVIHYSNNPLKGIVCHSSLSTWAEVRRDTFPITEEKFYRILYPVDVECSPPSEVLKKARSKLGENEYNPISNNCEHFASWCKTGKPESLQIWTLLQITGKGGLVAWFTPHFTNLRKLLVKLYEKAITKFDLPAVEKLWEKYTRPIEAARTKTASFKLALLISVILELALICNDYYEAYKKKEAGEMSKAEYNEVVVKRVAGGVCSVPMSIMGAALGQAICPIPIVGAIIGGIVGDFCGKIVGGVIGESLAPLLTDSSPKKSA